jgi:hypothetical protein
MTKDLASPSSRRGPVWSSQPSIPFPTPGQAVHSQQSSNPECTPISNIPSSSIQRKTPGWASLPHSSPPAIATDSGTKPTIKTRERKTGALSGPERRLTLPRKKSTPLVAKTLPHPLPPAQVRKKDPFKRTFTPLQPISKSDVDTGKTLATKSKPDATRQRKLNAQKAENIEKPPPVLEQPEEGEWDEKGLIWSKSKDLLKREEEERVMIEEEKRMSREKQEEECRSRGEKDAAREDRHIKELELLKSEDLARLRDKRSQDNRAREIRRRSGTMASAMGLLSSQHPAQAGAPHIIDASIPCTPEYANMTQPLSRTDISIASAPPIFATGSPPYASHTGSYSDTDEVVGSIIQALSVRKKEESLFLSLSEEDQNDEVSDTEVDEAEEPVNRSRTRRSTSRKRVYVLDGGIEECWDEEQVQVPACAQVSKEQRVVGRFEEFATSDTFHESASPSNVYDPFPWLKNGVYDQTYSIPPAYLSPGYRVSPSQLEEHATPARQIHTHGLTQGRPRAKKNATYSRRLPRIYRTAPSLIREAVLSPEPTVMPKYKREKRQGSTSFWPDSLACQEKDGTQGGDITASLDLRPKAEGDVRVRLSRSTARGRGRNGEWPQHSQAVIEESTDVPPRNRPNEPPRPVSGRIPQPPPTNIDGPHQNTGNAAEIKAGKAGRKRRERARRNLAAEEDRRVPRPALKLTKRTYGDENIQE